MVAAAHLAAQTAPGISTHPDPERLRQYVTFLASDELEGRRTGTSGADKAANYIAAEFEREALRPFSGEECLKTTANDHAHCYMQPFPFTASVGLGKDNSMAFVSGPEQHTEALDLRLGEDWSPAPWSSSGRLEHAAITFVGYGITSSELQRDDYAGANLKGRIALAFEGTPDETNPHRSFGQFLDPRLKATVARDHGAGALVMIAREDNFKEDPLAHFQNIEAPGDAGLPVAVISRQVARPLLEIASAAAKGLRGGDKPGGSGIGKAPGFTGD